MLAATGLANAEDAAGRWVPGLSFVTGALVHEREGAIESVERGGGVGDSRPAFAFVGVGAELSTPALVRSGVRPRLFVRSDVSWSLDRDEGLVNQDDPGVPIVPAINNYPVLGVSGQGQAMRVRALPLTVASGLGVSLAFDALGREFRIKPSVNWIWQRDEINLRFGHVESEGPNVDFCAPCRSVSIDTKLREDRHALGPGLEIEIDAARRRDLVMTLFAGVEAHRLLGDSRVDVSGIGSWTTDGVPSVGRAPSTLSGTYERSDWSYRVRLGLRVLWQPEE